MTNLNAQMTVKELRTFIRTKCKHVLIQARFGTSEKWVRIAKTEALEILHGANATDTAADLEIYGGTFGSMSEYNHDFYLGG